MFTLQELKRNQAKLGKHLIGYTDQPIQTQPTPGGFIIIQHARDPERLPSRYNWPVTYIKLRDSLAMGHCALLFPGCGDEFWNAQSTDLEPFLPFTLRTSPCGIYLEPHDFEAKEIANVFSKAVVGYFAPDAKTGVLTDSKGHRLLFSSCEKKLRSFRDSKVRLPNISVSLSAYEGQLDEGFFVKPDALASWRIADVMQRRGAARSIEFFHR